MDKYSKLSMHATEHAKYPQMDLSPSRIRIKRGKHTLKAPKVCVFSRRCIYKCPRDRLQFQSRCARLFSGFKAVKSSSWCFISQVSVQVKPITQVSTAISGRVLVTSQEVHERTLYTEVTKDQARSPDSEAGAQAHERILIVCSLSLRE